MAETAKTTNRWHACIGAGPPLDLLITVLQEECRVQRPHGLRHGSAVARCLVFGIRIPTGTWISISCGVGFCQVAVSQLIPRPEESYRVWHVWVRSRSLDSEGPGRTRSVEPWKRNHTKKLQIIAVVSRRRCGCCPVTVYVGFLEYFGIRLSVSFHQYSILIFLVSTITDMQP